MFDDTVETAHEAKYPSGEVSNVGIDLDQKENLKKLVKIGSEKLTDEEKKKRFAIVCWRHRTYLH